MKIIYIEITLKITCKTQVDSNKSSQEKDQMSNQFSGVYHHLYISGGYSQSLLESSVQSIVQPSMHVSDVYHILYVSDVYNQLQYIMNSLLLLCQRIPTVTCSKCIPYYAYYTCQSRSYIIETVWSEILSIL